MPPKKRTFNDFTSNPNAPTKANVAKRKRDAVKKQDREILQSRGVFGLTQKMKGDEPTLSSPYTKEELIEDFVYIDKDDPFEVITHMLGAGWAAKTYKLRKKLKKLGISAETFKGQKQLKKQLKKKHKSKVKAWENRENLRPSERRELRNPTLEGTARSSPHGKPLSSTDKILEVLEEERLKKLGDKGYNKLKNKLDKEIKTSFKRLMDDVDREVKKRHPDVSTEEWALWEKERTRGMLGSKTPINRYGHGKGIGKAIARATGGTHKDANRLARKLQKSDEVIKKKLIADKKVARKKSQKNILKSRSLQNKMKQAGRKQAGSLERGLPRVISPRYDPLKQYSARQN